MLAEALTYFDAGLAAIPLPWASKTPVIPWRRWQDRQPTPAELTAMFSDNGDRQNLALICGRASGGLLVLDADNAETSAEVDARLQAAGITTWMVATSRGHHFYLRTPEAVKSFKRGGLDGRGQGAYVLAPPSVHPSGVVYEFIRRPARIFELPSLNALDWLTLKVAGPSRNMPKKAWRLLSGDAATLARYASRSEAEAALCASLSRAGFGFEDVLRLLLAYPGPGKFSSLYAYDPDDARRYLWRTWQQAAEYASTHDSDGSRLAQDLRTWALSHPWPGRTGSTDWAVYLAHLALAERSGRLVYGASCRELAELSGITWQTARNANHRLAPAGLLRVESPATASWSTHYQLTDLRLNCQSNTYGVMEWLFKRSPAHAGQQSHDAQCAHDLFRRRGLGKPGGEVWAILGGGQQATIREIAEATGRHRETVRRVLKRMYALGLVVPCGDNVWQGIEGADLDQAAQELGTAGLGEAQRAKHERQRAAHRLDLERGSGNT